MQGTGKAINSLLSTLPREAVLASDKDNKPLAEPIGSGLGDLEERNPSAYEILSDESTILFLTKHQTASSLADLADRLLGTLKLGEDENADQEH